MGAYFKVLKKHFPGNTDENKQKRQRGEPVSQSRFEPATYQI